MKKYTIHLISEYGNVDVHEDVQNDSLARVVQLGRAMIDTYYTKCEQGEHMTLSIYNTNTNDLCWREYAI